MKIECERITNARDLGGLVTKDARVIKDNLLIRSNMLYPATDHDIQLLKDHDVSLVIDFRNEQEIIEKPDPVIEGVQWENVPIVHDDVKGITHDEETDSSIFSAMNTDTVQESIEQMKLNYRGFLTTPFSIRNYRHFLHRVMEHDGGVLWHCTAGKDRAGCATILVLELLGVDKETIFQDYMLTKENLHSEMDALAEMYMKLEPRLQLEPLMPYFDTRKEYFDAAYQTIEEEFGGMEAYLTDQMGITPEQREAFQKKCLREAR